MPEADIVQLHEGAEHNSARLIAKLENVVFAAGSRKLVDGLTISLRNNGITIVMGPNGAGKSLTLRLLARLLLPTAGHVHACGIASRDIALVFQTPVMLRRSVKGNLTHALKLRGVNRKDRPTRLAELLQMADLEQLSSSPARLLSGGEQQRLALVRALAAHPKLLLLDEPTASLDPQATQAIEKLVLQASNHGTKIVLVTHDIGQAKRLASDVVFLHQGFAHEHSPAESFFTEPQSPEAMAYLKGELLV
ncbi:ATP-binding cassette domain-containing protein [Pararhizobium sp. IMCC21322]|uniref:ATP-binding cassette domain-containing protein n=1 Tax=Pararhizobium sp. IMCC21322 TaxID=3067903 RepID=UPI0027418144|nr:ATP-binding cassette domain-containing protein [Pararhizobium sp. IMCC21322]